MRVKVTIKVIGDVSDDEFDGISADMREVAEEFVGEDSSIERVEITVRKWEETGWSEPIQAKASR